MKYSKKNIMPLIEKYGIDPENNSVFSDILEMFSESPNYHAWAIKAVFDKKASLQDMAEIKKWAIENKDLISMLSKNGNIVRYKSISDFKLLKNEMLGLVKLRKLKGYVSCLNTDQRNIVSECIGIRGMNGISFLESGEANEWLLLFDGFSKLPSQKKKTVINRLSGIRNAGQIKVLLGEAIDEKYLWNKEDLLAYVNNNTTDTDVSYNRDDIVVLRVGNYNDSNRLCYGRTDWCITSDSFSWINFVCSHKRNQYFIFNFALQESDDLAHVGFTVDENMGVTASHSNMNHDMTGCGSPYRGTTMNIYRVLREFGIPIWQFLKMKHGCTKFRHHDFIDEIVEEYDGLLKKVYDKDNMVGLEIIGWDLHMIENILEPTYINKDIFRPKNRNFIFFRTDESDTTPMEPTSVLTLSFSIGKYGDIDMESAVGYYGESFDTSDILPEMGLSLSDFVDDVSAKPEILLHKYISIGDECGAIDAIEKSEHVDINFSMDGKSALFYAIYRRLSKLVLAMMECDNFDVNSVDGHHESVAQAVVYSYFLDVTVKIDNGTKLYGAEILTKILGTPGFDYNYSDMNGDTILSVAATSPELVWFVRELLKKNGIDVNKSNDISHTAFGMAARRHNIDAMRDIMSVSGIALTVEDMAFMATMPDCEKDMLNGIVKKSI